MPTLPRGLIAALLIAASSLPPSLAVDWDVLTDLDQYVQSDDGHFHWTEVASYNYPGATLYIVNMTSQMWKTDAYSTHPLWWHWMGIAIPDDLKFTEEALLIITGGSNGNLEPPGPTDAMGAGLAVLAAEVGLIIAYIAQVPNQPIYFYDDPNFNRRTEDRLIAWTWRSFLNAAEPSDPTVIARMPMTKAAKRGLDTITELTQVRLPDANINKFVVLGASKRGWTTWSLAATDRRVVAQIPLVFSLLNMETGALPQHNRNLDGGWSWAMDPYWREDLTKDFFEPKFKRIYEVEDMYYFKERFTMPTLAMSSTGDYFFLLDENHHWWDDIPGPHYLMMLPNAEHTMAPHYLQIVNTAVSFTVSVLRDIPIPKLRWVMEETEDGGSITLYTDTEPLEIKAYTARTLASDTRRDFRLVSQEPGETEPWAHPVVWRQIRDIKHLGEGVYYIEQKKVEGEWVAFFFEGEWEGQSSRRMVFTSQVNVIPNTFPTEACTDSTSCYGWLV